MLIGASQMKWRFIISVNFIYFLPLHKIQCTNNPLWILDVEDQIAGKQQGEIGIEISDAFVDDNCMERISPPSSTNLLNVN